MPRPSPFARGFRALRREPSILLAEIAWRWLFGGIAIALLVWATMVFLHAVDVSKANQFLLRSLNPEIIGYVLRDLFRNKWGMLARLSLIVGVSLSFLWIVTSTIARIATTRVLLEDAAGEYLEDRASHSNFRSMAAIQFVRVTLLWIGLAGYFLSVLLASYLTTRSEQPHTGAFLLLFFCMFGIVAGVLSFFNWILLLAPIYAVRNRTSFSDSILAAWALSRHRAGRLLGLNLAHLAFRIIWIVFMSGVLFVPLGFLAVVPKSLVFLATIFLSLAYCAVADALFVARYAGYIEIAERDLHPEPEPLPPPEPSPSPVYAAPIAYEPELEPSVPLSTEPSTLREREEFAPDDRPPQRPPRETAREVSLEGDEEKDERPL